MRILSSISFRAIAASVGAAALVLTLASVTHDGPTKAAHAAAAAKLASLHGMQCRTFCSG